MDWSFITSIILGNSMYLLLLLAFVLSNILYLRITAIASSIAAITYYFITTHPPLFLNIIWESLFATANIVQIIILIVGNYIYKLSKDERKMYEVTFYNFTPQQFKKLLHYGKRVKLQSEYIIIKENNKMQELILIEKGKVEVSVQGKVIAHCNTGNFIGEMSFITGDPANATVTAIDETICHSWLQDDLRKLFKRDPSIETMMQSVLNTDLVRKIKVG